MDTLKKLVRDTIVCEKCLRLRRHCQQIALHKKREFRNDIYWGKPVPGFGDPMARLWIIGLAPGAHGANRTGRLFTGDSSGRWLFGALHRTDFSSHKESLSRNDDLKLRDVYISAAARCAPPDNKPLPRELDACSIYLDREFKLLKKVELILVTGAIAFQSACRLLERQGYEIPKPLKFGHGVFFKLSHVAVLASYHPSRQNTQTGKLTDTMWMEIFERARRYLNP